jgi:hypothetical protein
VPHFGQKLAASSGSCVPQFGQDSSSCSVCSSVNEFFSLGSGADFPIGYIPMRVEAKAHLLLARSVSEKTNLLGNRVNKVRSYP